MNQRLRSAEEERFETAIRWMAGDERGALLLRMMIRPAFEQPSVDPQLSLADAGRRDTALNWLRAIVTHAPGSVASLVIRTMTGGGADADGMAVARLGGDIDPLAGRSGGYAATGDAPDPDAVAGAHADPDDRTAAAYDAWLAARGP